MSEKERRKPNIIFIMADDLGYYDLGCFGQEEIETPNIDRLAKEGMRFTDCYSGASVCAPSRSVLMTGQHTGHTRIRGNFGRVGGKIVMDNGSLQRRVSLRPEDTTVAEVLKDAGYATGITGKWGVAEPGSEGVPNQKGFDRWFGYLNQRRAHTYFPRYLWQNGEQVFLENNRRGERGQYSHDLIADYALEFIKDYRKEPFFLYLPVTLPHGSFEIPDDSPYSDRLWSQEAKNYAAMVSRLDRDVGRVMDLLEELGLAEETLIFFTSDNGGLSQFDELFGSTGNFRGFKGSIYEGGLRVPMIARWPGVIPEGDICEEPCYFADFLPTAAEVAGIEPPADMDGLSLLPVLRGEGGIDGDRFLYWEQFGPFAQAVRFRNWKAVRFGLEDELELYDLDQDPGEKNDVSAEHPEVVQEIEEYLEGARTPSENWPIEL